MRLIIIIFFLFLTSCLTLLDESFYVQNLTKDFNINMVNHERTACLRINEDEKFGGKEIIPETITDVWFNDDFIVVKRSPNLHPKIKKALYVDTITGPYYQILDKRYLKFLPPNTKVKTIGGKYYHNSLNWTRPDSLYPYKKTVSYYIIDHRDYKQNWIKKLFNEKPDKYYLYKFNDKKSLLTKLDKFNIKEKVELKKVKTTR